MSKDFEGIVNDYSYTQNRDLSWLRFNRRVLEEAADDLVPPLERLKFISIFSSNLDEFFMVRVGSLLDLSLVSPDEIDNKSGLDPAEQLQAIYEAIPSLLEIKGQLYSRVSTLLAQAGVQDLSYDDLTAEEQAQVDDYFRAVVLPVLSPQIVGQRHPSPRLDNKALYITALLRSKSGKAALGFVPCPASLPPIFPLPESRGRFLRLETIVCHWTPTLFKKYTVEELCVISATRNADLSFDREKFEDSDRDFRTMMTQMLKKRANQAIVRLEMDRRPSQELLRLLGESIQVQTHQIYCDSAPLAMGYVYGLENALPEDLRRSLTYQPYTPRWPEDLSRQESMIEQIQRKDRLLFFPFDSIDPFLKLLEEAAERPDVKSIKITIYRLASTSKIARILCRAAENGKEVVALMELRARFDEANNIAWSKMLEEAGCKVIYGMENFKCHSKLCLITLQDKKGTHYITQVGTGNYNEKTSVLYTDLSVMTASPSIGADGAAFFRNMLTDNLEGSYQTLWVAPYGLKPCILALIDEQIAKGPEGYLCFKVNSVTEREVIDKLRQASQAGVEIKLIVRGICCLRPGVPGRTEHISVRSIIGRYLEHERIFVFGRGEAQEVFIGSGDLLERNTMRRIEAFTAVTDPNARAEVLEVLSAMRRDNRQAWIMQPDGSYIRPEGAGEPFVSQAYLHTYFAGRTVEKPAPPAPPQPRKKLPWWRRLWIWLKNN